MKAQRVIDLEAEHVRPSHPPENKDLDRAAEKNQDITIGEKRWTLAECPTGILVHRLFDDKYRGVQYLRNQLDAAEELARRRDAGESFTTAVLHKINQIVPPPCHCGRKGIYIVSGVTFCSTHRDEASRYKTISDAKRFVNSATTHISSYLDDRDRYLRMRDRTRARK